ncbi:hypothetical protein [Sinosporangium album]|uniref:WDGH domain-containing protein n=1 Tax=Sinosporangium album TaxID=504805 RepID=UPI00115FB565|nr:hypothetical protein [Sinosporangium album]
MLDIYSERSALVAHLAALHPSLISYNDPEEPEWPLVYIDTPEGQLSWHIAPSDLYLFAHVPIVGNDVAVWDGHDTPEKYRRLRALTARNLTERA